LKERRLAASQSLRAVADDLQRRVCFAIIANNLSAEDTDNAEIEN